MFYSDIINYNNFIANYYSHPSPRSHNDQQASREFTVLSDNEWSA